MPRKELPKRTRDIGRFRVFGGVVYKIKEAAPLKSDLLPKKFGGRVVKLPKGNSFYKQGDRWAIYQPA